MRADNEAPEDSLCLRRHHARRQREVPGLRLRRGEVDALNRVWCEQTADQHGAGLPAHHKNRVQGNAVWRDQHDLNGLHAA